MPHQTDISAGSSAERQNAAPFVLEHRRLDSRPDGRFTPEAAVLLSPALRRSGLLAALDAEDLQTLALVLSGFVANGGFVATPELVAAALGISAGAALARLRRLASAVWREGPLLYEQTESDGLRLFVPSAHLFEAREVEVRAPGMAPAASAGRAVGGNRAAVVAHSRAAYGRPRAEVEARIERFLLGEPEPSSPEEAALLALRRRVLRAGVTVEQADRLLAEYGADEVERQLAWLPLRHARNPAGYLIAAIEGGYEAPPSVRREESAGEQEPVMETGDTDLPETEVPEPIPEAFEPEPDSAVDAA